jgi:hypothetical protein
MDGINDGVFVGEVVVDFGFGAGGEVIFGVYELTMIHE